MTADSELPGRAGHTATRPRAPSHHQRPHAMHRPASPPPSRAATINQPSSCRKPDTPSPQPAPTTAVARRRRRVPPGRRDDDDGRCVDPTAVETGACALWTQRPSLLCLTRAPQSRVYVLLGAFLLRLNSRRGDRRLDGNISEWEAHNRGATANVLIPRTRHVNG